MKNITFQTQRTIIIQISQTCLRYNIQELYNMNTLYNMYYIKVKTVSIDFVKILLFVVFHFYACTAYIIKK